MSSSETMIGEPLKVGQPTKIPEDIAARVVCKVGSNRGKVFTLTDAATMIGRDDECQIILNDPQISSRHAMIYFAGGEFRVRDLDSTNGTLLNGSPLTEAAYNDGDDLRLGKSVLRLEIDFREPSNR